MKNKLIKTFLIAGLMTLTFSSFSNTWETYLIQNSLITPSGEENRVKAIDVRYAGGAVCADINTEYMSPFLIVFREYRKIPALIKNEGSCFFQATKINFLIDVYLTNGKVDKLRLELERDLGKRGSLETAKSGNQYNYRVDSRDGWTHNEIKFENQ